MILIISMSNQPAPNAAETYQGPPMFPTVLSDLLQSNPASSAMSALRFFHFVGLAAGLGGATLLDLMLLRFAVLRQVTPDTAAFAVFASKVIGAGLKLLWLTGAGFLILYALNEPAKLANPKVHAKLLIVAVLTLNGGVIHLVVLPFLQRQTGRSLFEGTTPWLRCCFLASGAVSVVSWYMPVALGVFWQLNNSVPAVTILLAYLSLIAVLLAVMLAAAGSFALVPQSGFSGGADRPAPPRSGRQGEGRGQSRENFS
ncbi:hypothetical protein [Cribrihabitans neustonicus]|uniref:hypothetical protein n=1 Tax=Cribrihabitans neustonicus TaxID=1429085 RepID=UPI003B5BD228